MDCRHHVYPRCHWCKDDGQPMSITGLLTPLCAGSSTSCSAHPRCMRSLRLNWMWAPGPCPHNHQGPFHLLPCPHLQRGKPSSSSSSSSSIPGDCPITQSQAQHLQAVSHWDPSQPPLGLVSSFCVWCICFWGLLNGTCEREEDSFLFFQSQSLRPAPLQGNSQQSIHFHK